MNLEVIANFTDGVEFDLALVLSLQPLELITKLRPNPLMIFLGDLLMYVEVAKIDLIAARDTLQLPY